MNPTVPAGAPGTVENERKFRLIADTSEWAPYVLNDPVAWHIEQGYLSPLGREPEVRCRRKRRVTLPSAALDRPLAYLLDGRPIIHRQLGVKGHLDGTGRNLRRREIEADLRDDGEFNEIRSMFVSELRKVRVEYLIDIPRTASPQSGSRIVTVDHFRDHLQGLVLAEVEFDSASDADSFDPPGFLGYEVTHDPRYLNAALASAKGPPLEEGPLTDLDL